MGKPLIQQRRGKGSIRFRSPSHNYKTKINFPTINEPMLGIVEDFIHDSSKNAPVAEVKFNNKEKIFLPAIEGLKIGDKINYLNKNKAKGSILRLKEIAIGANISSIEKIPNSPQGSFCRSAGSTATIFAKTKKSITILFHSKKKKTFHPECRAMLGIVAGSGRLDKPIVKAGKKHHMMKARNRFWPKVSGVSMNAVAHPFGSGRGKHLGKPKTPPRFASPGRKVGQIHAKRTGRKNK
ncbi:50S ribosomal protein L2 [archaeon]|nr:50S ribosomal protein L2 [archaeon]|tara:strand:- start:2178 stop:2891 length:714 start_codon:yes stop_codon:yes gene_type:complete